MNKRIVDIIKEERNRYIELTGKIPNVIYLAARQISELIDFIKTCELCAKIGEEKHTERHLKKCLKEHNINNRLTIYGMAIREAKDKLEIKFDIDAENIEE